MLEIVPAYDSEVTIFGAYDSSVSLTFHLEERKLSERAVLDTCDLVEDPLLFSQLDSSLFLFTVLDSSVGSFDLLLIIVDFRIKLFEKQA